MQSLSIIKLRNRVMNTRQAKKIPLDHLLAALGFVPAAKRKNGTEIWYNSPFRNEVTPSFKIQVNRNIWYDFGEGAGGNILDFVMRYKKCDLSTSLSFLENTKLQRPKNAFKPLSEVLGQTKDLFEESKHTILEIKPVYHYALKEYLKERCIDASIAFKYLSEIKYEHNEKEYFALGFANRAGGWEVRSPVFKGCVGQKDISVIENQSNQIHVFEGFMDFLSCLTLNRKDKLEGDVLVLNSVALKDTAILFIQSKGYNEVNTYFDNDKAGNTSQEAFAASLNNVTLITHNQIYSKYNDLNEYLVKREMKR